MEYYYRKSDRMILRCCKCGKVVGKGNCDIDGVFYPVCTQCWTRM